MDAGTFDLLGRPDLKLPLRTSPIRFAVVKEGGFTSDAWGVQVEKAGDAYIYCRTGMGGLKASLHLSGKQHIAHDFSHPSMKHYKGDRFMNEWWQPKYSDVVIPTLRLLFPSWGRSLNEQQRHKKSKVWDKNQILIPTRADTVCVVYFFLLESGQSYQIEEGSSPLAQLGLLKLTPVKSLIVLAGYEPERDMRKNIEVALSSIDLAVNPRVLVDALNNDGEDTDVTVCLTGYGAENSAFMLPVSVDLTLNL